MPLPASFEGRLAIPAIAAPMFLTSGPDLVVEACKQGVVGSFPALNQRTSEGFDQWLDEIEKRLAEWEAESGQKAAPYGVNLIVHDTNPRWQADLEICVKHKVPLIITSLGAVSDLVDAVHGYGGVVFHDITRSPDDVLDLFYLFLPHLAESASIFIDSVSTSLTGTREVTLPASA